MAGRGTEPRRVGPEVQTGFPILCEPTKVVQPGYLRFFTRKILAYSLEVYHVRIESFVLNHLNKKLGNDSCEEIQFLEPNRPKNILETDRWIHVL